MEGGTISVLGGANQALGNSIMLNATAACSFGKQWVKSNCVVAGSGAILATAWAAFSQNNSICMAAAASGSLAAGSLALFHGIKECMGGRRLRGVAEIAMGVLGLATASVQSYALYQQLRTQNQQRYALYQQQRTQIVDGKIEVTYEIKLLHHSECKRDGVIPSYHPERKVDEVGDEICPFNAELLLQSPECRDGSLERFLNFIPRPGPGLEIPVDPSAIITMMDKGCQNARDVESCRNRVQDDDAAEHAARIGWLGGDNVQKAVYEIVKETGYNIFGEKIQRCPANI